MKKTLAVLAVLAVAAAAQAELLATWTITGGAQSPVDNKTDLIVFDDLKANGLDGSFNSSQWRLNNWVNGGASTGSSLDAEFLLEDNYTFSLESITSTLNGGGNPAPANFAWYNGSTAVTDVQSITASRTTTAVTWTGNASGVWTDAGTISLKASDGKNTAGANASSSSWTSIQTVDLYGTVTATPGPTPAGPEPATMSLLGLGALAMALRRKLRK